MDRKEKMNPVSLGCGRKQQVLFKHMAGFGGKAISYSICPNIVTYQQTTNFFLSSGHKTIE
jgi:hypothetical protein